MQRHSRTWIAVVLAVAFLVPMGFAYGLARTSSVKGTRASCLDWAAVKAPATTTSTEWTNVTGMRVKAVLAQNFAVQVSGTFEGNPIQFRMLDTSAGGTSTLAPQSTTIRGGLDPEAFSFTWVGSNPAEHEHVFQLQWRLTGGAIGATMTAGAMTLIYQGAPKPDSC